MPPQHPGLIEWMRADPQTASEAVCQAWVISGASEELGAAAAAIGRMMATIDAGQQG